MKKLLLIILFVYTGFCCGREVSFVQREYSVKENLINHLVWKMKGAVFKFEQDGENCHLKSGGVVIHSWMKPLEVSGVIRSEKGSALLVQVSKKRGYYSSITRIVFTDGAWLSDEVLLAKHPTMKIRHRSVGILNVRRFAGLVVVGGSLDA
jgi:hypothetical protein